MYAAPSSVVVNVSEFFDTNSVIATLEWTQQNDVTYNVSIFPQISVVNVEMLGSSSVQLPLLYHTYYNVGIIATHCETTTTFIPLHYGKINVVSLISPGSLLKKLTSSHRPFSHVKGLGTRLTLNIDHQVFLYFS